MQDFTVTVAGSERHDGHKPYTYVVVAENYEDAAKKVTEHHRENNEDTDLVLVECFRGPPPIRSGYAWNDLRPKLKYMVVTVHDTSVRKAVVPVLSSLTDEEAEKLARLAVENCDSYGNIDEDEEIIEIVKVERQGAFKKGSYLESSLFDILTEEQLQTYAEAVLADPSLIRLEYDARRVLKVKKPATQSPPAPTATITEQQADQVRKYLDDDAQLHLSLGNGKWKLDKGKLITALEQAGIKVS